MSDCNILLGISRWKPQTGVGGPTSAGSSLFGTESGRRKAGIAFLIPHGEYPAALDSNRSILSVDQAWRNKPLATAGAARPQSPPPSPDVGPQRPARCRAQASSNHRVPSCRSTHVRRRVDATPRCVPPHPCGRADMPSARQTTYGCETPHRCGPASILSVRRHHTVVWCTSPVWYGQAFETRAPTPHPGVRRHTPVWCRRSPLPPGAGTTRNDVTCVTRRE
jgi:hypothetical protein